MERVFIGIGSNLGQAKEQVELAIARIDHIAGVKLLRAASLYGSKPFGPIDQNDFVNTVVEVDCSLQPKDLLFALKQLEKDMGRGPGVRWGPREIDLDILLYGDRQLTSSELDLPHAGILERAFVLIPLAELEPQLALPDGRLLSTAIERLDPGLVWPIPGSKPGGL